MSSEDQEQHKKQELESIQNNELDNINIAVHSNNEVNVENDNQNQDMSSDADNNKVHRVIDEMCTKYNLEYDNLSNIINGLIIQFRKKSKIKFDETFIIELIVEGVQAVEEVTENVTTLQSVNKRDLLIDMLTITIDIMLEEYNKHEEIARLTSMMKLLVPSVADGIIFASKNAEKFQKKLVKKCNKCC